MGARYEFANIPTCVEQNVNWIANCIKFMRQQGIEHIEPIKDAEDSWTEHVTEAANQTLLPSGEKANSWFTGANIEDKAHVINVYFGGSDQYFDRCEAVAAKGYEGFDQY